MKIHINTLVLFLLCCLVGGCTDNNTRSVVVPVIPIPQKSEISQGIFSFSTATKLYKDKEFSDAVVTQFADKFSKSAGLVLQRVNESSEADIVFSIDSDIPTEAYKLSIASDKINVIASDDRGLFYAMQTINQLLPPEIDSPQLVKNIKWTIPTLEIEDKPRFEYRGLMLDVSRYFVPKETVLKIINAAAMLKINKLHFHLVDDQGWRLEIKKYPKLTEVGAWRVYRDEPFPLRKNPTGPGEATPVGGYYTQEDIKEIVAFAADRQVEVIPEIEMPAHTNSSLAAYPQFACPVIDHYIAVLPGMGGRNSNVVYCAGNDSVYTFLEDVMDEVMSLFPSKYIHIGGDEANKDSWKKCPKCQRRMRAEGYTDEEDLQGYFMNRICKYIQGKGRQVIGWDEWTNSWVPDDAVIFGWQGLGEAGYKAAQQGHRFVMTPSNILYLNYYQGPQWFEPRTYFGNNTLKNVYDYEPVQPEWDKASAEKLMGVQGSMWAEFMDSPKSVEYMVFPRIAALADIAWAQKDIKDWQGFLNRLDVLCRHWEYMNINYSHSMYNLDHLVRPEQGKLKVALSCIRPDVEIRYTMDDADPTSSSVLYKDSVMITGENTIRAAAFKDGERVGEVLTLNLEWNKATAKKVINDNPNVYMLTNGVEGTDKHTDFEWCGWYDQDVSFVLDLGQKEDFNKIEIGHVVNYGMGVHYPASITVLVSDDNVDFHEIGKKEYSRDEIYKYGIFRDKIGFEQLNAAGRFIRFDIESPGKTPDFHHRAGQGAWLYFDEIKVF